MTSHAGDGSGGQQAPHKVYEFDLQDRYINKHLEWVKAKGKPEVPEVPEENVTYVTRSQADLCSVMASWHYMANTVEDLSEVAGIDSHWFDMKWVDAENEVDKCIHVNFTGTVDGCTSTFFAELVGPGYPGLVVKMCVECGPGDAMHNCRFCSGLWHPMEGGFHGQKKVKSRRKRRAPVQS
ncbi:hypothetical protein ACQ4PT_013570 [Festuca glaucescens]